MARKLSCIVGPCETNKATVRRRPDNRLAVFGTPWCALTTKAFRKLVVGGLKICDEIDADEKLARNPWVMDASGHYQDESIWTELTACYPTKKLALKMAAQCRRNDHGTSRNFRVRRRGTRKVYIPTEKGED
jgi:hypothetical protein